MRVSWVHPLDMAWLIMLLEGATLLVLGIMGERGYAAAGSARSLLANVWVALVEGVVGTALGLGIWHAAGLKVRGRSAAGPIVLRRVAVLPAGLTNAAFLFVLWLAFDLIALPRTAAVWYFLLGFAGMAATVATLIALYPLWAFKLRFTLNQERYVLMKGSLLIGICAAVYEAIILPVMWLLFRLPLPAVPLHVLTGCVAGFVGGGLASIVVNLFIGRTSPWMDLRAIEESGTVAVAVPLPEVEVREAATVETMALHE